MDTEDPSCCKAEEIKRSKSLVDAAGAGDFPLLVQLLKAGVSVNAEEYNKSLFYASKNYITPLQIASEKNHLECVKFLIECGADVNCKDKFDVTAVHVAAEKGHTQVLRELLDAGADCSSPTKYSKEGCYTAKPHLGGTTALHLAAANNNIDCVKELIQSGADYNAIDLRGRTSLYIAAQLGFSDCVLAHLRNAVGRDILSLPSFESGDTPLHFAVRNGMKECVAELLSLGSDPNHVNYAGMSPLHYAVVPPPAVSEDCAEEILHLLVLNGYNVDINMPDGAGFTPLHYVSFNSGTLFSRRPNIARFLISYGADPSIKNQRGYTLIESEVKSPGKDQTILNAVLQSVLHPPNLNAPKLFPSSLSPQRCMSPNVQPFYSIYIMQEHGNGDQMPLRPHHGHVKTKLQWYISIATSPRTLQHYCRFCIRSVLGYRRLRHVKDLPIPLKIQSYILLQCEDC